MLNDTEGSKVTGHCDEGNDKGQEREERGDKRTEDASAQAEQESQKGEASGNRMQNHDLRKSSGAITVGIRERDLGNLCQGGGGIVANVRRGAGIFSTIYCQSSLLTYALTGVKWLESTYFELMIQYPNVPYVILSTEPRPAKSTLRMERSWTTGAVTDTTIRSAVAASSSTVPM